MHMVRDTDIDDEMIALLKQHPGVFFGPNIGITSRGIDAGRPDWLEAPLLHETIPPAQIQKLEQSFTNRKPEVVARTREDWERAKRNIAKLRANGVTLALGSDSAGDPSRTLGWHAIWEVESLAMAGIPPMEVITMSTKTAAEILRRDQLGMVAKGKSADFIVLDASPLDDMANIRKISDVYLRGQAVDRAAMRTKWKAEWTSGAPTLHGGGGH
jgi:imidazolonepropionase-like amidohydrolase